jgi:4'-phosphopantetheinyl transferase
MEYSIFDNMERCTLDEVQRLLLVVPPQRREQALQFKHLFGQYACLKSFELLSELLAKRGIMLPSTVEFSYNEHGKPNLTGYPDICFNLSHCKNAIAVVVDNRPVGIDVERFISPTDSLLHYSMNGNEIEAVQQSQCQEQTFSRLWTRKEALFKLIGSGINDNIKQILINPPEGIKIESFENTEKHYACTIAYYG